MADEITLSSISSLGVDLVKDRISAQSTLYHRHLKGVKQWSTPSKMKFFANEFENGTSVPLISDMTATSESEVRKGIREYNLVKLALNLTKWTPEEKPSLNLMELKLAPFTRVFSSKSPKYEKTGLNLLQMKYDDVSLEPESSLERDVFEEAIYLIAKNAFFNKSFNTRNHVENIPELVKLLNLDDSLQKSQEPSTENNDKNSSDEEEQTKNPDSSWNDDSKESSDVTGANNNAQDVPNSSSHSKDSGEDKSSPSKNDKPKSASFFQNLTWRNLNATDPSHTGIIQMASEIQRLSASWLYSKYPIATAMLLRSLFEQSLKYHTKEIKEWDNLLKFTGNPNGYDPMLGKIIQFYKLNGNYKKFFIERPMQSVFVNSITEDVMSLLDTNVHNTAYARATREELDRIAAKGLFQLIYGILNSK